MSLKSWFPKYLVETKFKEDKIQKMLIFYPFNWQIGKYLGENIGPTYLELISTTWGNYRTQKTEIQGT